MAKRRTTTTNKYKNVKNGNGQESGAQTSESASLQQKQSLPDIDGLSLAELCSLRDEYRAKVAKKANVKDFVKRLEAAIHDAEAEEEERKGKEGLLNDQDDDDEEEEEEEEEEETPLKAPYGRQNGYYDEDDLDGVPSFDAYADSKSWRWVRRLFWVMRTVAVDLPLLLLFTSFVVSICLNHMAEGYFLPIIERVRWTDDDRLSHEYTYYDRQCDVRDVTTGSVRDLVVGQNATATQGRDNVMLHGMSVFPSVLSPQTAKELRTFILKRNAELTATEQIPLDGPYNRWSFAIGANEHESVTETLKEVYYSGVLKETIEALLGPNPAVVEVTAITAAHGAKSQGWHPDVKPEGNAARYSRTFTHSYSLFLPLQDTTAEMGATQLCPGTHYCTNELQDACNELGFQASGGPSDEGIVSWRTGDALLMNQCVWHRGYKHSDPDGPPRVVFIMTFLSRPRPGLDLRQLSHGTYFHIRYDMWGHTLNDLAAPEKHIVFPFSLLRAAGLYKRKGREFGWDYITSTALRISNSENGYHYGELEIYMKSDPFFQSIPTFLAGPVTTDDDSWVKFIKGTLKNLQLYLGSTTFFVVTGYLVLVAMVSFLLACTRQRPSGIFGRVVRRLILSYLFVMVVAGIVMYQVSQSEWSRVTRRGDHFARPFRMRRDARNGAPQRDPVSGKLPAVVSVPKGPTVLPTREDVLLGVRYDSRYIYAYNSFLENHPGNRRWKQDMDQVATAFEAYKGLPPAFREALLVSLALEDFSVDDENDEEVVVHRRRFLLQTEYGEWMIFPSGKEATKRRLILDHGPEVYRLLEEEMRFLLADCRYRPFYRDTVLYEKHASAHVKDLEKRLLAPLLGGSESSGGDVFTAPLQRDTSARMLHTVLPTKPTVSIKIAQDRRNPVKSLKKFMNAEEDDNDFFLQEGDVVEGNFEGAGQWFLGVIENVVTEVDEEDGQPYVVAYDVVYDDGDEETIRDFRLIRRYTGPFQEGDMVEVQDLETEGLWHVAEVKRVHPDRTFDVQHVLTGRWEERLESIDFRRYVV